MDKKSKKDLRLLIGNRIKSVRTLGGYNRNSFSKETGISSATLRIWEEPQEHRLGITETGVRRLISGLLKCGVHCTAEWLLHGTGNAPSLIIDKDIFTNVSQEVTWDEEESIFKDIESFKANNLNPTISLIPDDSMSPFYAYGDYVGGSKKAGNDVFSLTGSNCIIELDSYTLIRKFDVSNKSGEFVLSVLNPNYSLSSPIIFVNDIISVAKIVWHRSKEKTKRIFV